MSAPASVLVASQEVHNGQQQADRRRAEVRPREKSNSITAVGKVTIGFGTIALLASLAATSIHIGYFLLFPSALIILAGFLQREETS